MSLESTGTNEVIPIVREQRLGFGGERRCQGAWVDVAREIHSKNQIFEQYMTLGNPRENQAVKEKSEGRFAD